jgi:lipopolysaccharide biosynthesis glycosyltransferase
VHIALTFDAAYLPAASASIDSLLVHHEPDELHLWLVVTDDVSLDDRTALTRQVGDRARLSIVPAPATLVGHLPLSSHDHRLHVSRATYLRLHLPDLLPASVERFLYVDADTLCLGNLSALAEMDLGGAVVAAVRDPYLPRLADMEGVPGIEAFEDIDPQGPSFTPAVMLVDSAAWRRERVTEVAMGYCEDPTHACRYMDQDALNLALQGRWARVPSTWGFARTSRVESAWGGSLDGCTS